MKTIQVVLDERTLKAADREAKRAKINRSALVRRAIALYVARERERALEQKHRRGYQEHPIAPGEFDVWDRIQAWRDLTTEAGRAGRGAAWRDSARNRAARA